VKFYEESLRLYRDLSQDLDFNILYSERGHFTLAHTDAAMRTSRWRAEVNKHLGSIPELIYPDDIAKLCPSLNMSDDVRYPILGALYHPPGSIARHDAVAWGYAGPRQPDGRRDPPADRRHRPGDRGRQGEGRRDHPRHDRGGAGDAGGRPA
jgi:glycine/D-amino acid oxidase-like deaminating enzyme